MRTTHRVTIIVSCVVLALTIIYGLPASATAAARGQGVETAQLPTELRALTVQNQFIRGQGVPVGKVRKIRGHLIVRHGNSSEAYFAARGDSLYAHDELFTLNKSRVRVRFTTADIVNMGANSRIRVDELVDDRRNRRKKTRMSMLRGKAMFYVMRLLKYNKVDTAVTTPTAVCGVRGTKFGIIVRKKDDLWSSMPLYLADASKTPLGDLLADNGGGDGTETVMVMVEGQGYMTAGGTTTGLGTGQSGTAGSTGPPSAGPTPPGQGQGLNDDTNPDGGGGDGDGGGDGGDGDTGDSGDITGDAGNDAADRTGSVTQQGLAPAAGPENRIGYFAAMLTSFDGDSIRLENIFVSDGLQNHEEPGFTGTAILGAGTITLDGTSGDEPVVASVNTDSTGQLTGGAAHKVQATQIGTNQFLEWGYWTMTTPLSNGDGTDYFINNQNGVYVHGDPTPLENIAGITGHYTGTAWGTLWNASGGVNLEGTMQADVNLGSTMLNNFNVSTTGTDGSTVTIQQDSPVYFSGGQFQMDGRDASFQIDGVPVNGSASGGLFGTDGGAIGGTAAMEGYVSPDDKRAVLGFEGTRNTAY